MRDLVSLYVHRSAEGKAFQALLGRPAFVLVVAYTATVALPGLSAAGATELLRESTAAADAEILEHGRAQSLLTGVPSHPSGIPGPAILVRAAFDQLPTMPYLCVDAGLKTPPLMEKLIRMQSATSAQDVTTGQALPIEKVKHLFSEGLALGETLGQRYQSEGRYLIVAESVPGGTTTALGLLLGLGIDAAGKVSSSMPGGAHDLKLAAVQKGSAGRDFSADPLGAVAAVGDAMQPVVAGIVLAASKLCPVVLGGGTQMAAVLALIAALGEPGNLALVTTRWVSSDSSADLAGLALLIEAKYPHIKVPYLAVNLDLGTSRYTPLRAYEQGFVKEGIGAGAALWAACLAKNCAPRDLIPAIESVYERLVKPS
jgi:uncharacterized protein (TIGR00303 family)